MDNFQPKTLFIGKKYIYLPSCHSTNDIAAEIIQNKPVFDGTIVITADQTAGRGQRGNSWEAYPNENITVSIILRPDFLTISQQFNLNIAISLGIHEFLKSFLLNGTPTIKWPNDIYVGQKKMGGVLIENTIAGNRINYSVIGIGLNINQLNFMNENATSLRLVTQQSTDFEIKKLIESLCVSLEKYYLSLKNGHWQAQRKLYLEKLFRVKEWHYFDVNEEKFLGKIVDIAPDGRLMIEINNEVKLFNFQEIKFCLVCYFVLLNLCHYFYIS